MFSYIYQMETDSNVPLAVEGMDARAYGDYVKTHGGCESFRFSSASDVAVEFLFHISNFQGSRTRLLRDYSVPHPQSNHGSSIPSRYSRSVQRVPDIC